MGEHLIVKLGKRFFFLFSGGRSQKFVFVLFFLSRMAKSEITKEKSRKLMCINIKN